ncbi:hypothetical protein [Brachybacterium phenoliresistens]|uniref:Uncharacterized protein n=1 Tax=Brachybacterium phenoliresistens TaxID=396014 RepID=Z9JST7_9MICO|nr:hypothetical protein [Brachybacterium phenoliresistens]EWS80866.1 hypothetical protein BF93_01840 [Brachybacterium phenoliresistens]
MARHIATLDSASTTTRRSLMKGVAWATPVAVVSIAAPAVATSPTPPIDVSLDGDSCKYPGQSTPNAFSYKLIFNIENNRDYDIEWRVTSLYVDPNSGSNITFPYSFPTAWTSLSAHGSTAATFISNESTNSSNGSAVFTFEVRKVGGGAEQPVSGSISIGGLPPCKGEDAAKTAARTEEALPEEEAALVEDAPEETATVEEEPPAEEEPAPEEQPPAEEKPPVTEEDPAKDEAPAPEETEAEKPADTAKAAREPAPPVEEPSDAPKSDASKPAVAESETPSETPTPTEEATAAGA